MITVANRDEYAGASVSAVIAEAKVSKPTFYEYFKDREDCFIAAVDSVHARLLSHVLSAASNAPHEQAATAGVRALLEFPDSEPALAHFITTEPLAGPSAILDARDEGIAQIAGAIEDRLEEAEPDAGVPDLPVVVVIGGLYRLLGARARRGQALTDAEVEGLLQWLDEYNVPRGKRRWHTMQPSARFAPFPEEAPSSLRAPEPLPPGRPTLSEADVAANQRLRIIFAAGRLANDKGYAAVTVAEIAKLAQVDLRVFYSLFAKKQEVFLAAQEHGFQEGVALSAAAFFAGPTWPERIWAMGLEFHRFLQVNPRFARIGFVESCAAGRDVAQRTDEGSATFTIFLQEGLQFSSKATLPTRVAMETLVSCNFENIYLQLRASRTPQLLGLLPNVTSLWLTPFLGPTETNRFVDEQTAL
jgi:AcrR family transcriptional regulator